MKKMIIISLIIAVSFFLVACGEEKVEIENNDSPYYGTYDMTGEFGEKIKDNPIDQDYEAEAEALGESENFSTVTQMELESKYATIWDTELNAVYNKLREELDPAEQEILLEAQRGWLQYHTKEAEFVGQVFYLRETGAVFGSQGNVQMLQAIKERVRERTIELMEYWVLLGNNVEFEYESMK